MATRRAAILATALLLALGVGGWLAFRALRPAAAEGLAADGALARASSRPAAELAAVPLGEARRASAETGAPSGPAAPKAAAGFTPPADAIWLMGRVVFPPGTPPDERVRVVARGIAFAGPSSPKRHVVDVARDGSFRVAVVQGAQCALVQLESRWFYWPEVVRVELAEHTGPLVIEPRLGGRLAGRVRLSPGAEPDGFEGVELVAHSGRLFGREAPRDRFLAQARPDDEGRFDFRTLAPGLYSVAAHSDEHADTEITNVRVEAGASVTCEIVLRAGIRLAGRVTDEAGEARWEARLVVWEVGPDENEWTERSQGDVDAAGVFDLRGIEPGNLLLSARANGFLETSLPLGELATGESVLDLVLVLERGLAIEGTVRWPDGRPAESADLSAVPRGAHFEDHVQLAESDADGRFVLSGLDPREHDVEARARRGAPPSSGSDPRSYFRCRQELVRAPATGVELVLERAPSLSGVVRDSAGAPVAGASVEVRCQDFVQHARTDHAGAFGLPDLQPGLVSIEAVADGSAPSETLVLELQPGEQRAALVLTLVAAARITGVVLPGAGQVAGRDVQAQLLDGTDWLRAVTDQDGQFELEELAPGKRVVWLLPDFDSDEELDAAAELRYVEASSFRSLVNLAPGETAHVELGAEPEQPIRVAGRVTRAAAPVAGAVVGASLAGTGPYARSFTARTAADGSYELTVDGPGSYEFFLATSPDDELPFERDIPDEALFTLDFALPAGRMRGHVVDEAGAPIAGHTVLASPADPDLPYEQHHAETDELGAFELIDIPGGRYVLFTDGETTWEFSGEEARHARIVVSGLELEEGGALEDLRLVVPRPGTVVGLVEDGAGRPAPGARVQITTPEGYVEGWEETDDSGHFRIPGVAPGRWLVSASPEGQVRGDPVPVDVAAGAESEVRVRLP